MRHQLLTSIFNGIWAMPPSEAQAHFPFIYSLLVDHNPIGFESKGDALSTPFLVSPTQDVVLTSEIPSISSSFGSSGRNSTKDQFVGVLPIKNVIIKYDESCGPTGTETMAAWFNELHNNPNVSAIIIDADSPGGQGTAVQLLSSYIKNSKKPVITYGGNGMMASAMYWIGSNSKEIYTTFPTDEVGSIGTYVTLINWMKFYESKGLDIKELYASRSTDKNRLFIDVLDGKEGAEEKLIKAYIDPFNEQFISVVKENRPNVKESALTGKLFMTEDAIKEGLIDGVKTFAETVERAFELAEENKSNNSNSNTNSNTMSLFGKTKKAAGFAALISFAAKSTEERTADELQAVNDELKEAGIEGFLFESTEELPTAEAVSTALSDRDARITELEAEVSTLKGKIKGTPAAEKTETVAETADDLESGASDPHAEIKTSVDAELDEMLAKRK